MTLAQDLRLEPYSTCILFGATQSGKSSLSLKIAVNRDSIYKIPHDKCIIFHKYDQEIFEKIKETHSDLIFVTSKDQLEECLSDGGSSLIIFDDFLTAAQTTEGEYITQFFLARSHHKLCTIVFQSQVLIIEKGRDWIYNCHYFVFLRNSLMHRLDIFSQNQPKAFLFPLRLLQSLYKPEIRLFFLESSPKN